MTAPQKGDRLTTGTLYRRISNTEGHWDYSSSPQGPGKMGFRPRMKNGVRETGISTYLASLTTAEQVLEGHEDYGLVIIDIAAFHEDLERARADGSRCPEIVVEYDPSPEDGLAHCYIQGLPEGEIDLPGAAQKCLRRVAKVERPAGPKRVGTGLPQGDDWNPRG